MIPHCVFKRFTAPDHKQTALINQSNARDALLGGGILGFQTFRLSGFQAFRLSGFQAFRLSGFEQRSCLFRLEELG